MVPRLKLLTFLLAREPKKKKIQACHAAQSTSNESEKELFHPIHFVVHDRIAALLSKPSWV
jgi:hypothetical protein